MPGYSFSKELRLLQAKDYKSVFDHAPLKVSNKTVLFLARPNGENRARLGLVIAKKNVRTAVQRNRIKRIIRETFRHHQLILGGSCGKVDNNQDSNHPKGGIDIVVLARRGLDQLDNQILAEQFTQLWKRLSKKASKGSTG